MKKFLIVVLVSMVFFLSACEKESEKTVALFDGNVLVQRLRARGGYGNDEVIFVFIKNGQYDLAFYKNGSREDYCVGHELDNFSITVNDAPYIETIDRDCIPSQRVSITNDGISDTQIIP